MAVKEKKTNKQAKASVHEQIVAGIVKAAQELYTHHQDEIQENLNESESKKVAVTFPCEIDCSESEPLVTVKIRFSSSVTDKRVFRVDDANGEIAEPGQVRLFASEKDMKAEAGEGEPADGATGEPTEGEEN